MTLAEGLKELENVKDGQKPKIISHLDLPNLDWFTKQVKILPAWMRPNSRFDLQSYYPENLPGMNIPQLFIKSAWAWTGLHGEDSLLSSVNINFGPGIFGPSFLSKRNLNSKRLSERILTSIHKSSALPAIGIKYSFQAGFWISTELCILRSCSRTER